MADGDMAYTVLFLHPERAAQDAAKAEHAVELDDMIRAAARQDVPPAAILVAGTPGARHTAPVDDVPVTWVPRDSAAHNRAGCLNAAMEKVRTPFVLLVASHDATVLLARSAARTMLLAAERNEGAGLVYADYTLVGDDEREVHLLKHHVGRLRDNQDMGRAWLVRTDAAGRPAFNASLRFHELYDFRLRISEKSRLVHVANRYDGSLCRAKAAARGHNVFDYLLASKESQVEAERVVTEHLERIGAYLAPGQGYHRRPALAEKKLKASVVIPVNNRPAFIGVAIESVLQQTVPEVEVIVVVNGGPDDPTAPAVERYQPGGDRYRKDAPAVRLIVLDVNNIGLCLNAGIAAAEGAVYMQLDSDDRLKPDAVEKALAVYAEDPHVGMVIGSYEVWQQEADGRRFRREDIPVVTHDEWTEENGRNNLLRINGAGAPRCIPVEIVKAMGWFSINDEPFSRNYGEDYDMVLRISERYRVGRIWEPIYEVVRHAGGTDHSIDPQTIDRNDEAKDWMRREAVGRRQALNRKGRSS